MNTLFSFLLVAPFTVFAIRCPQATYKDTTSLPTKNSSVECEFFSRFCTRTIITKKTTFHSFQQVQEKILEPGVYYTCSEAEPANFEGDGVSIHHCNTDDCTADASFVRTIQCGDLVTSDPNELPTRYVHCGGNGTCFRAVATKSGQVQLGATVFSYSKGATYSCGNGKCPVDHNGDGLDITCCSRDKCNYQVTQQNSAASYFTLITVISFINVMM